MSDLTVELVIAQKSLSLTISLITYLTYLLYGGLVRPRNNALTFVWSAYERHGSRRRFDHGLFVDAGDFDVRLIWTFELDAFRSIDINRVTKPTLRISGLPFN